MATLSIILPKSWNGVNRCPRTMLLAEAEAVLSSQFNPKRAYLIHVRHHARGLYRFHVSSRDTTAPVGVPSIAELSTFWGRD